VVGLAVFAVTLLPAALGHLIPPGLAHSWMMTTIMNRIHPLVTSLTADADSFNSNRRLFSAVRPVVSPEPPEGPARA
jgi:hypothetical protein